MPRPLRTTCTAIFVAIASTALARAQTSLEWLAIHDGPASQTDYGSKCAVDAGGNVYVCGRSYNPSTGIPPFPPSADFETVKYSPAGVELWSRRLDGFGDDDFTNDVAVDAAGNVYVTGYSWHGVSSLDLALIKYLADGTLAWSRFYDGPGAGSDNGRQIAFDSASNVIVVGSSTDTVNQTDLFVVSYSPQGQLLWSTRVDGAAHGADAGFALAIAPSGDIYAAGQLIGTASAGDIALVKLSSGGALQWTRTVDGGSNAADAATTVAVSGNDRIAIAGYATRSGSDVDFAVVEYDAAGNGSTLRTYDGPTHGTDRARSIAIDASGVLWVLGISAGGGSGNDFATLRYDAAGQLLTTKRYDGAANRDDDPRDIVLGNAGGAWACGNSTMSASSTDIDVVIVQYDADGNEGFANTFSTPGLFSDSIFDADPAPNGRLALAGWTTGGASGGYDYLALQLDVNALPQGYCTGKVNSLGCAPLVDFAGLSSASASSGFVVRSANVRNNKNGLLFYGVSGSSATPFQGGTLCVKGPIRRTPAVNSLGTPPPASDCTGVYALDLNAFAAGALGGAPLPALLVAGTQVNCQWWGRDPGFVAPNNTALSSGLSYRVLP